MKKLFLTLGIALASYFSSFAQWATLGTDIYNTNTGNVGIGTNNPAGILHVSSASSTNLILESTINSQAFMQFNVNGNTSYFGPSANSGLLNGITNGDMVLRSFGALQISANNTGSPQLTLTNSHVGIGTTNPSENLSVVGGGSVGNVSLIPGPTYSGYKLMLTTQAADEGFNMTTGGTKIMNAYGYNDADEVGFGNLGHQNLLYLNAGGNVGINTTDTKGYKFAVNGSAIAESVTVKSYGTWPDYVFKPKYKLPSLDDVKTYIDKNQHLPEMPSEQEVAKNGINLGEIVKIQTKKIEELTLYLIEQKEASDKQNKLQQDQINQLKEQLATLIKANK